jgi:hypothetical protein
MMRAGKDYITKGAAPDDDPQDARSKHLQELLQAVGVQVGEPVAEPIEAEEKLAAKPTNQDKPTLKLSK